MSFTFNSEQIAEIKRLFKIANDISDVSPMADASNKLYADVYAYIHSQIPPLLAAIDTEVGNVERWFAGATDANRDVGPFAEFIRSYTAQQAELRGVTIDKMQIASNEVARNAIRDILKPENGGLLPTIEQIAEKDATGVGKILFNSSILPNDSANDNQQNSAWSGTILFSGLGSDQTGRLLGGDGSVNTVGDLKELLFAYDATRFAVSETVHSFDTQAWENFAAVWRFGSANSSWTLQDGIGAIFGNTAAFDYIKMVHNDIYKYFTGDGFGRQCGPFGCLRKIKISLA
jgi:hypothetical protein